MADPRGIALIKRFEDFRAKAYKPTPKDVWTCGWGHTKGVGPTTTCTEAQATEWLAEDLDVAERAMRQEIPTVKLSPSARAALTSLIFNTGTLGETIPLKLRRGEIFEAWEFMTRWRKQGRKDLRGLARRRAAEMELFMEDPFP